MNLLKTFFVVRSEKQELGYRTTIGRVGMPLDAYRRACKNWLELERYHLATVSQFNKFTFLFDGKFFNYLFEDD